MTTTNEIKANNIITRALAECDGHAGLFLSSIGFKVRPVVGPDSGAVHYDCPALFEATVVCRNGVYCLVDSAEGIRKDFVTKSLNTLAAAIEGLLCLRLERKAPPSGEARRGSHGD